MPAFSCGPGPSSHNLVGYRAEPCLAVPTCGEEAQVFTERTSVGLDVHARSVVAVAAAFDGDTGEVLKKRLTTASDDVIAWVR